MTSRDRVPVAAPQLKPDRIALAILIVYILLLGGSEVGVFSTAFRTINSLIGGILVAWWIVLLRRGADRVDLLAMGTLLAFLWACVFSTYPRQSFDAAVSALAWAAAFGVARRYLAADGERLMLLRLLSLSALLLSLYFAVVWGSAWIDWVRLSATAPPLDLHLPAHIYRHHYVVAMLLAVLMPASAALLRDRAWRFPAGIALVLSVSLIVMSGSRGVWLAMGMATVILAWRFRPSRRVVAIGLVSTIGLVAAAAMLGLLGHLISRALTSSTVTFRVDIWLSTLAMLADSPLFGIGPGAFGIGITFEPLQEGYAFVSRHADNAVVQLAAEAGVVGLLGAVIGITAVWTGRRTEAPGWLPAAIGITVIAGLSLTNNPLDSPNLAAIALVWCALLAPHTANSSHRKDAASMWSLTRAGTVAAALAVAVAVGASTAASILHAAGISAVRGGDVAGAIEDLRRATTLDPAMALYRRELGVLLIADGHRSRGIAELEAAVDLNPADTAALRSLAPSLAHADELARARAVARRAAAIRPLFPENHLVRALVAEPAESGAAIGEAIAVAPWLTGSPAWSDPLPTGSGLDRLVREAADRATDYPSERRAFSIVWLRAVAGLQSPQLEQLADRIAFEALTATLLCKFDEAEALHMELGIAWTDSAAGTAGRILLDRERHGPELAMTIALASLQQWDLAAMAQPLAPFSASADPQEDARLYRRLSIGISTPGTPIPRNADGMSGWLSGRTQAACAGGAG